VKKTSIRFHLANYSIHQKRVTTINHAFASAIAPVDKYDSARLDAALRLLNQEPDGDLCCVYCRMPAETWDHLVGLVKNGNLNGYGHQLGNLVPCCKRCNSKKGAKDWIEHLRSEVPEDAEFERRQMLISSYLRKYASPADSKRAEEKSPDKWNRYCQIKNEIIQLMKEADTLTEELRGVVVAPISARSLRDEVERHPREVIDRL
jgi:hypothetical protein